MAPEEKAQRKMTVAVIAEQIVDASSDDRDGLLSCFLDAAYPSGSDDSLATQNG